MINGAVFVQKGCIEFPPELKEKFDGYLGEEGKGVYISFIISKEPRQGNFSKLLQHLKERYEWIKIPTPSNLMRNICLNKDFISTTEYFPEPFNEEGEILLWRKNNE